MKETNQKSKKRQIRRILFGFVLLILLSPMAYSLSRYITDNVVNYYLESQHFYFNSDKLAENFPTYTMNNWSGLETFTIDITLDSKKNELEASPADIKYVVNYECEENVECTLSKTEGTIYASSHTDKITLKVDPVKAFLDGESTTMVVTATSEEPYVKTIRATFVMTVGKRGVSYEIQDQMYSPYFMLNITNALTYYRVVTPFSTYQEGDLIDGEDYLKLTEEERKNCVSSLITLTFDPRIIVLDTTHAIMETQTKITTEKINGVDYINSITFPVEAASSEAIRFYKYDKNQDYTYPIVNETSIVGWEVE